MHHSLTATAQARRRCHEERKNQRGGDDHRGCEADRPLAAYAAGRSCSASLRPSSRTARAHCAGHAECRPNHASRLIIHRNNAGLAGQPNGTIRCSLLAFTRLQSDSKHSKRAPIDCRAAPREAELPGKIVVTCDATKITARKPVIRPVFLTDLPSSPNLCDFQRHAIYITSFAARNLPLTIVMRRHLSQAGGRVSLRRLPPDEEKNVTFSVGATSVGPASFC